LATTDIGLKLGVCPLGVELGLRLTVLSGLRPTIKPSGILIHPAIWPLRSWAENWVGVAVTSFSRFGMNEISTSVVYDFSAMMLLVGRQEEHSACKK